MAVDLMHRSSHLFDRLDLSRELHSMKYCTLRFSLLHQHYSSFAIIPSIFRSHIICKLEWVSSIIYDKFSSNFNPVQDFLPMSQWYIRVLITVPQLNWQVFSNVSRVEPRLQNRTQGHEYHSPENS